MTRIERRITIAPRQAYSLRRQARDARVGTAGNLRGDKQDGWRVEAAAPGCGIRLRLREVCRDGGALNSQKRSPRDVRQTHH